MPLLNSYIIKFCQCLQTKQTNKKKTQKQTNKFLFEFKKLSTNYSGNPLDDSSFVLYHSLCFIPRRSNKNQ